MSTPKPAEKKHSSTSLDWFLGSKIRDGRYGPVFLGMRSDTGEFISAEELTPQDKQGEDAPTLEGMVATIESRLAGPSQPNVISCLGYQRKDGRMFILTEYLPGGTLRDLIRNYGAIPQPLARTITRQVALGLEQLRGQGTAPVFLDLDMVMMDNVGVVKIEAPLLDVAGQPLSSGILAPPPEVLLGQQDTRKADVWLLGVMAAQLLTGKSSLAEGGSAAEQIKQAQGSALELLVPEDAASKLDEKASDFIRQCFSV